MDVVPAENSELERRPGGDGDVSVCRRKARVGRSGYQKHIFTLELSVCVGAVYVGTVESGVDDGVATLMKV